MVGPEQIGDNDDGCQGDRGSYGYVAAPAVSPFSPDQVIIGAVQETGRDPGQFFGKIDPPAFAVIGGQRFRFDDRLNDPAVLICDFPGAFF